MLKFFTLLSATAIALSLGVGQRTTQRETPGKVILAKSPNRRYEVRFSDQRADSPARKQDKVLPNVPVKDAPQAIALFQHFWDSIVLPGLPDESQKKTVARNMSDRVRTRKLSAHLRSYREMFARVNDTLTASERESLILYGVPEDLDKAGQCWVIESFAGCPCSEVSGCIDAKTGELVFVWVMPEG